MREHIEIRMVDIVGSALCTASEDGQKVYSVIAVALRDGKSINLSFENAEDMTSAFLNSSIGKLYGEFSEEEIKEKVSVTNISDDDLSLLKKVVDRAKEFFKDPERFYDAKRKVIGGGDDRLSRRPTHQ